MLAGGRTWRPPCMYLSLCFFSSIPARCLGVPPPRPSRDDLDDGRSATARARLCVRGCATLVDSSCSRRRSPATRCGPGSDNPGCFCCSLPAPRFFFKARRATRWPHPGNDPARHAVPGWCTTAPPRPGRAHRFASPGGGGAQHLAGASKRSGLSQLFLLYSPPLGVVLYNPGGRAVASRQRPGRGALLFAPRRTRPADAAAARSPPAAAHSPTSPSAAPRPKRPPPSVRVGLVSPLPGAPPWRALPPPSMFHAPPPPVPVHTTSSPLWGRQQPLPPRRRRLPQRRHGGGRQRRRRRRHIRSPRHVLQRRQHGPRGGGG